MVIVKRIGWPSKPKPPLLTSREARKTRVGDSSVGYKFGAERTPEILAATATVTATIKLGGRGGAEANASAVANAEMEYDNHGSCFSLMNF